MNNESLRSVWLHVHVPKAGGSTIRQLLNRNFGDGYYNSTSLLETKQYTNEDVSEIVRCHPWVTCFSDHKLSLQLPFQHEFATIYALCFVRDPVDRFISRYFFHRHFEEVQCVAQRMSFQEFAHEELVEKRSHPQTNSQVNFLNGGISDTDMSPVESAMATGRTYLFPVERFDEACILLEKRFPEAFPDLSYVLVNVSKRDQKIEETDRDFVAPFLESDRPLIELANRSLDERLEATFGSAKDIEQALDDFQNRCQAREANFP